MSVLIGVVGAWIASLFGGWDTGLQTLVILMSVDYITGLIVAGVFKKSTKSNGGALESSAGWKGLCRKGMTLLVILVAYQVEKTAGTDFIRNAVIIAYIANESLSILENAVLMGLPIPDAVKQGIDVLKKRNQ